MWIYGIHEIHRIRINFQVLNWKIQDLFQVNQKFTFIWFGWLASSFRVDSLHQLLGGWHRGTASHVRKLHILKPASRRPTRICPCAVLPYVPVRAHIQNNEAFSCPALCCVASVACVFNVRPASMCALPDIRLDGFLWVLTHLSIDSHGRQTMNNWHRRNVCM